MADKPINTYRVPVRATRSPASTDAAGALDFDAPSTPARGPWRNTISSEVPAPAPAAPAAPAVRPATAAEAAQRFYDRYGLLLIAAVLGLDVKTPVTVEDWYRLAEAVRMALRARQEARKHLEEKK